MKVFLRSFVVICSIVGLPLQAQTLSTVGFNLKATVISVGDGDTISIELQNGKRVTIRLACIDAPETAQSPWGKASSLRLKQLLPVGQPILERSIETDRYGRTVAEIFIGSQSINLQMVQEGQAVVYKKYLNNCNQMQQQYLDAEVFARQQKLGFWNQTNPQMPWDYRHGN